MSASIINDFLVLYNDHNARKVKTEKEMIRGVRVGSRTCVEKIRALTTTPAKNSFETALFFSIFRAKNKPTLFKIGLLLKIYFIEVQ